MARIGVESRALSDPRFRILAKLVGLADGDHARGKCEHVWNETQERGDYVLSPEIIDAAVQIDGFAEAMIRSELAELADGGVRVRGTAGRIEWLEAKRATAASGGRAAHAGRSPEERSAAAKALAAKRWSVSGCGANAEHDAEQHAEQDAGAPAPAPAPATTPGVPPLTPPSPSAPVAPADAGPRAVAEKPKRRKPEPIPEPPAEWGAPLRAAWADFAAHRREIGKPLRATGARLLVAKVEALGPTRAEVAIRHSIAAGWQGLFEPKPERGAPRLGFTAPPKSDPPRHKAYRDLTLRADADPAPYQERLGVPCPECFEPGAGIAIWYRPSNRTARVLVCDSCQGDGKS
jgi:hypothetical protein